MQQIEGRIELGYYMNDREGRVSLRVIDWREGANRYICETTLTPRQFRDIVSGKSTVVTLEVADDRVP